MLYTLETRFSPRHDHKYRSIIANRDPNHQNLDTRIRAFEKTKVSWQSWTIKVDRLEVPTSGVHPIPDFSPLFYLPSLFNSLRTVLGVDHFYPAQRPHQLRSTYQIAERHALCRAPCADPRHPRHL